MTLQNSVHFRALEHARDAIRSVNQADGGFRDLRQVTAIVGDTLGNRGRHDVEVRLDIPNIGLGGENPNLVSSTSMEFEVSIWFVVSEENPSEVIGPARALNYLFRDVWKALMTDPQRGGLAFTTRFVNGRFGESDDDESGYLAVLDWECEFDHDAEDIAVIHTDPVGSTESV